MKFFLRLWNWLFPRDHTRYVVLIEDDTPPEKIHDNNLILARENGEDWAVAFLCPCGCGDRLELPLIKEVKPNWTLMIDDLDRPTLHPSIWRKTNCKSHFWIKTGTIIWCN